MKPDEIFSKIAKLEKINSVYQPEAYSFVLDALQFSVRKKKVPGHVSGQELLDGIREFGLREYGPMVRTVFEHWGVRQTIDFGYIVFDLIQAGFLRKRDEDSLEDFKDRYDFKEVFDGRYEFGEN